MLTHQPTLVREAYSEPIEDFRIPFGIHTVTEIVKDNKLQQVLRIA